MNGLAGDSPDRDHMLMLAERRPSMLAAWWGGQWRVFGLLAYEGVGVVGGVGRVVAG